MRSMTLEDYERMAGDLIAPEEPGVSNHVAPNNDNNNNPGSFNVVDFLNRHKIDHKKTEDKNGATKYKLAFCPLCASTGGNQAITVFSNGAISFKCFESACSEKKWQDVRTKFEPPATTS